MPLLPPLPMTLSTASILALFCLGLVTYVGAGRARYRVPMGDGGNTDMVIRMRTHANFIEYVPLMLILMGLLELSGVSRIVLGIGGALLVVFRVTHAIGMPRPAPNFFRAVGALGTVLLMAIEAVWGLMIVFSA